MRRVRTKIKPNIIRPSDKQAPSKPAKPDACTPSASIAATTAQVTKNKVTGTQIPIANISTRSGDIGADSTVHSALLDRVDKTTDAIPCKEDDDSIVTSVKCEQSQTTRSGESSDRMSTDNDDCVIVYSNVTESSRSQRSLAAGCLKSVENADVGLTSAALVSHVPEGTQRIACVPEGCNSNSDDDDDVDDHANVRSQQLESLFHSEKRPAVALLHPLSLGTSSIPALSVADHSAISCNIPPQVTKASVVMGNGDASTPLTLLANAIQSKVNHHSSLEQTHSKFTIQLPIEQRKLKKVSFQV